MYKIWKMKEKETWFLEAAVARHMVRDVLQRLPGELIQKPHFIPAEGAGRKLPELWEF